MARTSKKTAANKDAVKAEDPIQEPVRVEKPIQEPVKETAAPKAEQKKPEEDIPAHVKELMKLYPQYERLYVTPQGFVHPMGVPEYLRKGAVLYKNIYYKK